MEIKISTKFMLQLLNVISWIIFIGLCIVACGFISSTLSNLLLEPSKAKLMWHQADLTALLDFDKGYFIVESFFVIIVAIMKVVMFYLIIKTLSDKKLNIAQPFSVESGRFIFKIAYLTLGIGLFSYWGAKYSQWFIEQGIKMASLEDLNINGADVWLFTSIILFVIAHIFKRGIEIQTENELTV